MSVKLTEKLVKSIQESLQIGANANPKLPQDRAILYRTMNELESQIQANKKL